MTLSPSSIILQSATAVKLLLFVTCDGTNGFVMRPQIGETLQTCTFVHISFVEGKKNVQITNMDKYFGTADFPGSDWDCKFAVV